MGYAIPLLKMVGRTVPTMDYRVADDTGGTVDVGECYRTTDTTLDAPFLGSCMAVAAHDDETAYLAHLKTVDNPSYRDELDAVVERIRDDLGVDATVFSGGTVPDTPLTDDPGPAAARRYAEEALDAAFSNARYDWCDTFAYSRVTVAPGDITYEPDWE